MKKLLTVAASVITLAGAAFANDTMDAMIGAKVTYTYADGTIVTATYKADGTYSTDSVGGGKWTIDGNELCIETDSGDKGCTTLEPGRKVGDAWQAKDAFGNDVTIAIIESAD